MKSILTAFVLEHIAIIHQKLQSIFNILALVPSSVPPYSKAENIVVTEEELEQAGIFASQPYQVYKESGVKEEQLKREVVYAFCHSKELLLRCTHLSNRVVRTFNDGLWECMKITRLADSDDIILWQHAGKEATTNKVTFKNCRRDGLVCLQEECVDNLCHRLMKGLSELMRPLKQILGNKFSSSGNFVGQVPVKIEKSVVYNCSEGILDCFLGSAALKTLNNNLVEPTPSFKKRRLDSQETTNIFCLNYGDHQELVFPLGKSISIPWLDDLISCLNGNFSSILYNSTPQLHCSNVLCTLVIYARTFSGNEFVTIFSCNAIGVPVKAMCYRFQRSVICSANIFHLDTDITSIPLLHDPVASNLMHFRTIEYLSSHMNAVETYDNTLIVELVRAWLQCCSQSDV